MTSKPTTDRLEAILQGMFRHATYEVHDVNGLVSMPNVEEATTQAKANILALYREWAEELIGESEADVIELGVAGVPNPDDVWGMARNDLRAELRNRIKEEM